MAIDRKKNDTEQPAKSLKRVRVKTVRYMFSMTMLIAMLALYASVITSQINTIHFSTQTGLLKPGETFAVDVFAEAFEPVNALRLELSYRSLNNLPIEVFGIDRGQSVITLWTAEPIITRDSITLEGGTYRRGFVGKHRIATLQFRVSEPTTLVLQVTESTMLAGDGSGRQVATSRGSSLVIPIQHSAPLSRINLDTPLALRDISIFMAEWRNGSQEFDFNSDGVVNFRDFSILLSRYFSQNNR